MLNDLPESDHFVCIGSIFVFSVVETSQTEVSQLYLSLIVDENVGALDVSMQKVFRVAIVEAVEELLHEAGNLLVVEIEQTRVEQTEQVVVHVLEYQVELATVLAKVERILLVSHNLDHVDNVWMLQLAENFDLAHSSDRKSLLLVF